MVQRVRADSHEDQQTLMARSMARFSEQVQYNLNTAIRYLEHHGFSVTALPLPIEEEKIFEAVVEDLEQVKQRPPQLTLKWRKTTPGRKKGKPILVAIVGRFMINTWRQDHDVEQIWEGVRTSYQARRISGITMVRQALAVLIKAGLIDYSHRGGGRTRHRYRLNTEYDPNHADLYFLRDELPNGFRNFDLT